MRREERLWQKFGRASVATLLFVGVMSWAGYLYPAATGKGKPKAQAKPAATASVSKQVKIDLNKAIDVTLPVLADDLQAGNFKTADGKQGWALRIPGGRPIATPAYADGMIFVGGGYGSHEFYAFDAQTGALRWQMKTSDDGPSAAVVEDGLVAFNTESCTLIVVEAKTGKVVWQEWLGDPLMSQPAISKGRVYIAYPSGQRGGGGDHQNIIPKANLSQQSAKPLQQNQSAAGLSSKRTRRGGHVLLAADLRTGRHIWEQEITADVISAPVVSEDKIYFTCFDGTSFALNASDGSIVWQKMNSSTSAPTVAGGQVLMTQKEVSASKSYEGLKRVDAGHGEDKHESLLARESADYLGENKGGGVAMSQSAQTSLDSSVGFSTAPVAANLGAANRHLGVNTVAGGWAYQGSRAAYSRGQMLNAQGRYLNSINADDGRFAWRAEVQGKGVEENAQVFSPPALGDRYMYLSSALGHLLSVRQDDGEMGFLYLLKQPLVFQPALAEGNIYVGTSNGMLICLKTGNPDADGWYAWGGNAQHNKSK
ncbi:MAG TPA: PQQ-binding-like beta-propeller repeat protein [Pyrinomonadaceae bacterium]|jgi:Ca-activated chloride channel family protein|nr:PQQ-binding-like beta-propeller repeat protein [Pyrinomonadaceae bacterium]